ncbi:MAG: hypothetical protein Q7U42_00825, partial [Parvibaculum sp.]|nr:hypothetical protein [Parvibaculum sp.]
RWRIRTATNTPVSSAMTMRRRFFFASNEKAPRALSSGVFFSFISVGYNPLPGVFEVAVTGRN